MNATEKTAGHRAEAPAAGGHAEQVSLYDEGPGMRKRYRDVAIGAVVILLFALCMLMSYSGAFAKPAMNHVEISVAGNAEAITELEQNDDLEIDVVKNAAAVKADVQERESDGGIVIPEDPTKDDVTTYVASGSSKTQASAISSIGDQIAKQLKTENTIEDLAKLPADNPAGTLEFYAIVFVGLGASLGATVMGRILGTVNTATRLVERTIVLVVLGGLLAGGATFWIDTVMDGLTEETAKVFIALWLYSVSVGGAVTGLAAIGGTLVAILASLLIVLLGNPSSGGPYGIHMLNDFYQFLYYVMPQGDGLEILRSIIYFDGNGLEAPLVRLVIWAGAGILLAFAAMLVRVRKDHHERRAAAGRVQAQAPVADARVGIPTTVSRQDAPAALESPAESVDPPAERDSDDA